MFTLLVNASNNSIFLWYHRLCRYFSFPETNFCSKDLTVQMFSIADSESRSELAGWQSPQTQYICTHPRKQNQLLWKNILLLLLSIYDSFFSPVMNYELSTRPWCCTAPSNVWSPLKKKKTRGGTALYIHTRLIRLLVFPSPDAPDQLSLSSLLIVTCRQDLFYCMSSQVFCWPPTSLDPQECALSKSKKKKSSF